jgi:hypothetical protein
LHDNITVKLEEGVVPLPPLLIKTRRATKSSKSKAEMDVKPKTEVKLEAEKIVNSIKAESDFAGLSSGSTPPASPVVHIKNEAMAGYSHMNGSSVSATSMLHLEGVVKPVKGEKTAASTTEFRPARYVITLSVIVYMLN